MFFHNTVILARRFATLDVLSELYVVLELVGQKMNIRLLIFHMKIEVKEQMNLFKH
jgi:hypothetical protein